MSGMHQHQNVPNPVDTGHFIVKSCGPETAPSGRVQHLTAFGTMIKFDPNIKVESYLRSLNEMLRMADNYVATGSVEQAYILYLRYLTLAVEKLPLHPGFKDLDGKVKLEVKGNAGKVLSTADSLKHKLLEKFTKEHEKYLLEEKIKQKIRESDEERLKDLEKEEDELTLERLELEKKEEAIRIEKRKLEGRCSEIKQERQVLLEKLKQHGNGSVGLGQTRGESGDGDSQENNDKNINVVDSGAKSSQHDHEDEKENLTATIDNTSNKFVDQEGGENREVVKPFEANIPPSNDINIDNEH